VDNSDPREFGTDQIAPPFRVAALEEMVARTHERAAELYESWLEQRPGVRSAELTARARGHRERATAARSPDLLGERTVHRFEVAVAAATPEKGKAGHLVVLAALNRLRRVLDARIESLVVAGRGEGASWAEIGAALGVTRQTAHERYRRGTR
jgi:hypothetical protein